MQKKTFLLISIFVGLSLFIACSNETPKTTEQVEEFKAEVIELDSINQELDNTADDLDTKMKALDDALEDLD